MATSATVSRDSIRDRLRRLGLLKPLSSTTIEDALRECELSNLSPLAIEIRGDKIESIVKHNETPNN